MTFHAVIWNITIPWHQVGFDTKLSQDVGAWVQMGGGGGRGGGLPGHGLSQTERRAEGGLDEEEQASWLDVTGAVSASSAAQSVPNENLYGTTLAADLHGLEEATGQSNVGGP